MDRNSLRFPRINLARLHARRVSIFATYQADPGRLALLPEPPEELRDGRSPGLLSFGRFKPRGLDAPHLIIAATVHANNDLTEIHAAISYREAGDVPTSRRIRGSPEYELLTIMKEMGIPEEASGFVEFQFARNDVGPLWFPLPVPLSGMVPDETIEVRGVRGVKLSDQGETANYEFIMDLSEDNQVLLTVEQNIQQQIDIHSITALVDRASSVAKQLVSTD